MPTTTKIDPSLLTIISSSLEALFNAALRYDPASQQRTEQLQGILAVEITLPATTLYLQGQQHRISVMAYCETDADTTLKGSPLALFSLLQQPSNLKDSGVILSGDAHLLSQWQTLIQQLDIDWEDAISYYLGDIVGPLASSGLHKSAQWSKQQFNEQQRLIGEYLSEELNIIPSRAELEHFSQQVDQLSLDGNRIAARAKTLINHIKEPASAINKDSA